MQSEVGDVVRFTVVKRDASGNAVDAGAVAVSVTLPDGTSALGLPAATKTATGSYQLDYQTVQAGRHLVRWVGTGANAFAQADVCNVWPADPKYLITLDDAKRAIQRPVKSTSRDDDIRLYIAAVTPVIEDMTGPLVVGTRTKTFDGGRGTLVLPCSVQSATVTVDGVAVNAVIDKAAGIVSPYPMALFGVGVQNVVVTYVAGESIIPPNLLLAAREEFRFLWQTGQEASHSIGGTPDGTEVEYTPSGFAVPRKVYELCSAHPRMGGFA